MDVRQIEIEARRRLTEWRDLLQLDVVGKSRQMLKKLLAAPLCARPIEDGGMRGWELTGRGSYGKLLAGLVDASTVASPMLASWNQIGSWLKQIDGLRQAA